VWYIWINYDGTDHYFNYGFKIYHITSLVDKINCKQNEKATKNLTYQLEL